MLPTTEFVVIVIIIILGECSLKLLLLIVTKGFFLLWRLCKPYFMDDYCDKHVAEIVVTRMYILWGTMPFNLFSTCLIRA